MYTHTQMNRCPHIKHLYRYINIFINIYVSTYEKKIGRKYTNMLGTGYLQIMDLCVTVNFFFIFVSIFQIFYTAHILLLFYKLTYKTCLLHKIQTVPGYRAVLGNRNFCDGNILHPRYAIQKPPATCGYYSP